MNVCVTAVAMVIMLRDFGPHGIISMNVCVAAVAMVMLLRNFGPYGIIFMTVYLLIKIFPLFLTGTLLAVK
jgi:hypothetical protein